MKKPPDMIQTKIEQNIPSWFNFDFIKNINYPQLNEQKILIPEIINSEKYILSNNLNNNFIKIKENIFDKDKFLKQQNLITTNNKLTLKQKTQKIKTCVTKMNKNEKHINSISKSIKINLNFNMKQRKKILKWFKICDKVYNYCVSDFNNDRYKWLQCNLLYTSYKLKVFNDIFNDKSKGCPYDILTDEVRVFCSNIKSCETNLKNKNISRYEITKRKIKFIKNIRSILIPAKSITNNGLFVNLLGKNNKLEKYLTDYDIQDSRLIYDINLNKFTLNLVRKVKMTNIDNRSEFISIDPGENIFCSYFSSDSYGYFGKHLHTKYLYIRNNISRWKKILESKMNLNNQKIKNHKKITNIIRNLYLKIKNITKEMHNKLSLYLCNNYKRILLPEFKVSKMVHGHKKEIKEVVCKLKKDTTNKELINKLNKLKKENRLSKKVKFCLLSQAHYKFKQHLIAKANEYGCLVEIVTEEYTSKSCCKCGILSNDYNERIKTCDKCKYQINRDINGSINILNKNHNKILNIKTS